MRSRTFTLLAVFGLTVAAISEAGAEPPLFEVKHQGVVWSVAWSFDGKVLASAGEDGIIRLTETATGKERGRIDTQGGVKALVFSPDGGTLAVKTTAGSLGLWSVPTGKLLKNSPLSNYAGNCLAFSADGRSLTAAGVGEKMIWNHANGSASGSRSGNRNYEGGAAVSADGKQVVWSLPNGNLQLYDHDARQYRSVQLGPVRALAFAPDGKALAVGRPDKTVILWDLANSKEIRKLEGLREPAACLVFSSNGKTLAAVGNRDTTIRLWDVASGRSRRQLTTSRSAVTSLALSPDGRTLVSAGEDGRVLFWNVATRDPGKAGPPVALAPPQLEALWADLGGDDLAKAENAFKTLANGGAGAVNFLAKHLRKIAVPAVDAKRIEQLLRDLDDATYAVRQKASLELTKYGELAIVPLQKLLAAKPSLEVHRRASLLLAKLTVPELTPERVRALEAIELLELMRTPEARQVLEEIARDALITQIRQEAVDALQRLDRQSGAAP